MSKIIIAEDINRDKFEISVADLAAFRPSIYGILVEGEKVLLTKQWDGYDIPGGAIELGETMDEALEREFFEETGVKVKRGKIIDIFSSFFRYPNDGKNYNCLLIYCKVERIGGELSDKNFDKDEKKYKDMPEWVDIENVKQLKLYNPIDNYEIIKRAKNE